MAKDPAFLFYSSDFLTGTVLMDNEQVGMYIRLMCLQHQKGHLTEKEMLKICGRFDESVFSKFARDTNGLFFNERLEEEIIRRKKYSESRRKNRQKKEHMKNICKTYEEHMENENIYINNTLNIYKRNIKGVSKKYKKKCFLKKKELKINYAENVTMTNSEYQELVKNHGETFVNKCIQKLSSYKRSKGKTYASDYGAILSWVVDCIADKKTSESNAYINNEQTEFNNLDRFYVS